MFSVYHSLFDIPNLLNSRITLKRLETKPTQPHSIRTSLIRPISDGIRLKAIYPGELLLNDNVKSKNMWRKKKICCLRYSVYFVFVYFSQEHYGVAMEIMQKMQMKLVFSVIQIFVVSNTINVQHSFDLVVNSKVFIIMVYSRDPTVNVI